MKRFYLATGLKRIEEAKLATAMLREHGWAQTYAWEEHGSLQSTPDRWPEVARKEMNGVITADVVIVLLPGGRGTHVELGAAIAVAATTQANKKIFLVYEDKEVLMGADGYVCIFYNHPMVQHVTSVAEVIRAVEQAA